MDNFWCSVIRTFREALGAILTEEAFWRLVVMPTLGSSAPLRQLRARQAARSSSKIGWHKRLIAETSTIVTSVAKGIGLLTQIRKISVLIGVAFGSIPFQQ